MFTHIISLLLIVLLLEGCQPAKTAVQFHNDPARTGVYETQAVQTFTGILWQFKTGDEVWSSPILADGVVYFGSDDQNFYALDSQTGQEKWHFTTGGEVRTAAAVYGRKVYFTGMDGQLYALDTRTGKLAWQLDMQADFPLISYPYDEYTSSPLILDGVIYVGSLNAMMGFFAVDAESGKLLWNFTSPLVDVFRGPASYANGMIYIGGSNQLYALEARTGKKLFHVDINGSAYYAPAVSDGMVFFSSKDTYLYAIDAATGEVRWKTSLASPSWVTSSPVVLDGVVYAGTSDGRKLFALDAATGEVKWNFYTAGWTWSSPVYAEGIIYIGSYNKTLYAIDSTTGKEKWSYQTNGPITSSPLVWDGVVYVGSLDGNLYALH